MMTKRQEAKARKDAYNAAFSLWMGKYTTAHRSQMERDGADELHIKKEWRLMHSVLVSEEKYEMAQAMGDALVRYKTYKELEAVNRFEQSPPKATPPDVFHTPVRGNALDEANDDLYEDINIVLDDYINSEITKAELMDTWYDIMCRYENQHRPNR